MYWRRRIALLLAIAGLAAGAVLLLGQGGGVRVAAPAAATPAPLPTAGPAPLGSTGTAPAPLAVRLDDPADPVRLRFHRPPRGGLLFDVSTGRVLWRRNASRVLPIASLTKMMTALVVADRVPRRGRVRITPETLRYRGSGVGLL